VVITSANVLESGHRVLVRGEAREKNNFKFKSKIQ
jgi:hypothetical protein